MHDAVRVEVPQPAQRAHRRALQEFRTAQGIGAHELVQGPRVHELDDQRHGLAARVRERAEELEDLRVSTDRRRRMSRDTA